MKPEKIAVIVDSREPLGLYLFKKLPVWVIRDNLDVGDFSLLGYEKEIMIERKTLSDLTGSFTAGRERFEAEWERAKNYQSKTLLIEGRFIDIALGNYRAEFHEHSFLASIFSWQIKYGFNLVFCEGEAEGQVCVYWILREFLRLSLLKGGQSEKENSSEKES